MREVANEVEDRLESERDTDRDQFGRFRKGHSLPGQRPVKPGADARQLRDSLLRSWDRNRCDKRLDRLIVDDFPLYLRLIIKVLPRDIRHEVSGELTSITELALRLAGPTNGQRGLNFIESVLGDTVANGTTARGFVAPRSILKQLQAAPEKCPDTSQPIENVTTLNENDKAPTQSN
jgi:hypothetical protein